MPIYWFALSQASAINLANAVIIFLILHFLVYPSSNGYNSYMDKDTESIGGIENPLPVSKQLFYVSFVMDVIALALSFLINWKTAIAIFIYILASRLYSYRGIRLKKYPLIGYLIVILCQGALVYYIVSVSLISEITIQELVFPAIISSFLIGGIYPLTQVYQHKQDEEDGVKTISYMLGVKGTFAFCGIVLLISGLLLTTYFVNLKTIQPLLFYYVVMLPVGIYFTQWFLKVSKQIEAANFKNMMKMNYIASVCANAAFIGILVINKLSD